MQLEILLSTMYQKNFSFIELMNIKTPILIVNQGNFKEEKIIQDIDKSIKMINKKNRGLSKSRNLALRESTADICILADDDEIFEENYASIIEKAYLSYTEADIIVFRVDDNISEKLKKKYRVDLKKINYISAMRVRSVDITFKRSSIISKNIFFNEDFGAGSEKYLMGEESIFLYECLKKGLKIVYLPYTIGRLNESPSTWFTGFNHKYFYDKGACFTAMSTRFSILLILQFCIRKYFLYKHEISLLNAIKNSLYGRKSYLLTK